MAALRHDYIARLQRNQKLDKALLLTDIKLWIVIHTVSVTDKEYLCITHTVEHNYISRSSAVGIQLHVSALYVGHLQVVI